MENENTTPQVLTDEAVRKFKPGMPEALCAVLGAACVAGIWKVFAIIVASFAAVLPYAAGAMLFATVLGAFYYLLHSFKSMRANNRLRISFLEIYTGVALVTVMGFFATSCLHAFQASGALALNHWNQGCTFAIIFAVGFGISKFVGELWNAGKSK